MGRGLMARLVLLHAGESYLHWMHLLAPRDFIISLAWYAGLFASCSYAGWWVCEPSCAPGPKRLGSEAKHPWAVITHELAAASPWRNQKAVLH